MEASAATSTGNTLSKETYLQKRPTYKRDLLTLQAMEATAATQDAEAALVAARAEKKVSKRTYKRDKP